MTHEWRVPAGYVVARVGGCTLAAREASLAAARTMVEQCGSLHAFAAAHTHCAPMRGRGVVHRVAVDDREWVIRHYQRGGALARLLRDRYLRGGPPRPWRELAASAAARARGVPTPHVEAVQYTPATLYYRGDIATQYVPDSCDLAAATFAAAGRAGESAAAVEAAWRAAGVLLRHVFAAGVVHADLNVMNILIVRSAAAPPQAMLLDLDRARVVDRIADRQRARMLARFHRSRRKLERRSGVSVATSARAAFEDGLHG